MNVVVAGMLAVEEEVPEDVGKSGPLGLLLIVLLLIVTVLLVKSMTRHLSRLPASFDREEPQVVVPDTPAELVDPRPTPGQELLDALRRAPRAIEPPRRGGDDRRGG